MKLPERRPDSDMLVNGGDDGKGVKRGRSERAKEAGAAAGEEGKVSFAMPASKAPKP